MAIWNINLPGTHLVTDMVQSYYSYIRMDLKESWYSVFVYSILVLVVLQLQCMQICLNWHNQYHCHYEEYWWGVLCNQCRCVVDKLVWQNFIFFISIVILIAPVLANNAPQNSFHIVLKIHTLLCQCETTTLHTTHYTLSLSLSLPLPQTKIV